MSAEFAKLKRSETALVEAIAKRARRMYVLAKTNRSALDVEMDLLATIVHCPLLLADLLDADDENFRHDILGIERHLNRETGQLEDFFDPRFAQPQSEQEQQSIRQNAQDALQ